MLDTFITLLIYPITQIIELIFTFSQKIFKEPLISIVLISLIISCLCLPLYNAAERWQEIERNTFKRLKSKINKINSIFYGDERFLILQTFYRQNHYHPVFAMRSTFGLLLQIPFFIAAYSYISELGALKGSSFLFIENLAEPDRLITLGSIGVNILPVLMTLINIASGALYSRNFSLRDKAQLYGIALIFLILLYNSPSGLVIYWTFNNIFSLIKNIFQKLPFKHKEKIALTILSLSLVYLSFHLLFLYNGNFTLRLLISTVSVILIIIIWIITLNKNNGGVIVKRFFTGIGPKTNTVIFVCSLATLCILAGLYLPAKVIVSSPQEFSFIDHYTSPLYFIVTSFLRAASVFIVWPLLIYLLLSKYRAGFAFFTVLFFVCSLVNTFAFSGHYGLLSLNLVFDGNVGHNFREIFTNLIVLSIAFLTVLFLYLHRNIKIIIASSIICLISILSLSVIDLLKINSEYNKVKDFKTLSAPETNEIKPLFSLSQTGRNTIIIILDRAVSVFIPYILEEDPGIYEKYSGFTYFPNTVSFNGYTRMAAPPLFGGYEYTPSGFNQRNDVSVVTKHNESLLLLPQIFSDSGYKVTFFDPPYPNYSNKDDLEIFASIKNVNALVTDSQYTDIWLKEHDLSFASTGDILKRNLLWYSLFRMSPLALRQGIYLQGDWCAPGLTQKMTLTLNGYAVLDYLPRLTDITIEKENTALIMVNNTTHEPSFLEAPEYRPVAAQSNYGSSPFGKETAYHVNIAALKRIGEWLDYLKSEQVYDNTKIIIVSDHGPKPNFVVTSSLPFNIEQFNPLLLVKDFYAAGNLKTDNTFMTNADVPFIALDKQINDPVNPFTGNQIKINQKLTPFYIAVSGSIHLENPNDTQFKLEPKNDYYVEKNIFDQNNWKRVTQ